MSLRHYGFARQVRIIRASRRVGSGRHLARGPSIRLRGFASAMLAAVLFRSLHANEAAARPICDGHLNSHHARFALFLGMNSGFFALVYPAQSKSCAGHNCGIRSSFGTRFYGLDRAGSFRYRRLSVCSIVTTSSRAHEDAQPTTRR